jgi:hypothetical protein
MRIALSTKSPRRSIEEGSSEEEEEEGCGEKNEDEGKERGGMRRKEDKDKEKEVTGKWRKKNHKRSSNVSTQGVVNPLGPPQTMLSIR